MIQNVLELGGSPSTLLAQFQIFQFKRTQVTGSGSSWSTKKVTETLTPAAPIKAPQRSMQRWEPKTTKVRASKKKLSDQSDNYSSPMPTQKSIKYTPFMRYSKYRKIIRLHQNQISQSPFYIYIFHGFSYGFPWFSIVFLMKIIKNSPHRIASRPSSVEKAKPLTKRLKVTDSKRSWLFCGGYGYVIWKNDKKGANIFEGSLEVKLPTIWTHEKQRWDESEKRREENRREEKRRE